MNQFVWIDFVIIGIIGISALVSLMRGFVREALSLVVWALAIGLGWVFFREAAVYLEPWIDVPSIRLGAAFGLILISTLIVGGIINYLMGELVDKTGLSGSDRVIGMLFGAVRGALLVTIIVVLASKTPLSEDPWWQQSQLVGQFEILAEWLLQYLPEDLASSLSELQQTAASPPAIQTE